MHVAQLFTAIPVSPVLNANDTVLSDGQGLFLLGAIFFLAGLAVIYFEGGDRFSRARQYLSMGSFDPEKPDENESVAVKGVIRELDGTVTGSLSGEEVVVYEDERQVYRRDWFYDDDERQRMRQSSRYDEEEYNKKVTEWQTTAHERESVPFLLETASGSVVVDLEGAKLDLPVQATDQSSWFRRFLHKFVSIASLATTFKSIKNPRRRIERHVKEGDTVVVMGNVDEPESVTEAVGSISTGRKLFMVTTRSPRTLALRNLGRGLFVSIPGFVFVFLGSAILIGGAITGTFW